MQKIGNGKHPLTIHKYKGFDIIKNGTPELPWNIYDAYERVGSGRTIKDCKSDIDNYYTEQEERK